MDTGAIGIVLTFASIQFLLCWNFHRSYRTLHGQFKKAVDSIAEKRRGTFRDKLGSLVVPMFKEMSDPEKKTR